MLMLFDYKSYCRSYLLTKFLYFCFLERMNQFVLPFQDIIIDWVKGSLKFRNNGTRLIYSKYFSCVWVGISNLEKDTRYYKFYISYKCFINCWKCFSVMNDSNSMVRGNSVAKNSASLNFLMEDPPSSNLPVFINAFFYLSY